jgi:signal transduction histidine kinase
MLAQPWRRGRVRMRAAIRRVRVLIDQMSLRDRVFVLCWASIGVACAVAGALSILSQGAELDQRRMRELGWAHDTASTLEKDFTSLARDMYRMAASTTPAHIDAAWENLEDFRNTFAQAEPILLQPQYRDVHAIVIAATAEFESLLREHEEGAGFGEGYVNRISVLDNYTDAAIERVRDGTAADQEALFSRLDQQRHLGLLTTFLSVAAAALLMLTLSMMVGRSIRRSVSIVQRALGALARGERNVDAPGEHRKDEFGDLGRAVRAFHEALIEGDRLRAEAERTALEERDLSKRLSIALSDLERERASLEDRVLERTLDLEAARHAAEEANAAKTRFIANMSHELRTPLNAIIGYSEIMREGAEAQQREEDLADHDRVLSASRRLLVMINEILDLSKIEAGTISVAAEAVDVGRLIQGAVDTVRPQADANGNTIVVEIAHASLGDICSDHFKLHQCLANLLSNAAKFTRHGIIAVRARRERDQLVFEVQDTGIGIPADAIDALFQPFVQADNSSTRNVEGTGLGLSITRNLARLLGGDVTAQSVEGRGSTFRLAVSAELAPTQETHASALSKMLCA